jgi:hypothetical protein
MITMFDSGKSCYRPKEKLSARLSTLISDVQLEVPLSDSNQSSITCVWNQWEALVWNVPQCRNVHCPEVCIFLENNFWLNRVQLRTAIARLPTKSRLTNNFSVTDLLLLAQSPHWALFACLTFNMLLPIGSHCNGSGLCNSIWKNL